MIIWPFGPSVDVGLVAAEAGYVWLSRRYHGSIGQAIYFAAGLAVVWLALETPLDPLGDRYLQSAHMVQHMLLVAVSPPLLLLGLSDRMASAVLRVPGLAPITRPALALAAYSLTIAFWHLPPAYDVAIANPSVHVLEHLAFVSAGAAMWWPVLEATGSAVPAPLTAPMKLAYLFLASLPMMTVALVLQLSQAVFYAAYRSQVQVFAGITPLIDQNIAGSLMLFIDIAVIALDMFLIFLRWVRAEREADGLVGARDA